jgi:hypothetical protein
MAGELLGVTALTPAEFTIVLATAALPGLAVFAVERATRRRTSTPHDDPRST